MQYNKLLTLSLLSVLAISTVTLFWNYTAGKLVATVGIEPVSRSDLHHAIAAEACYGNAIDEQTALINLIDSAIEKETLRLAYGYEVSALEQENRSRWIDKNTKAPDILVCVKKSYANDTESYYRWYVSPTIVNPLLHEKFSSDPVIQKIPRESVLSAKDRIDGGKKLSEIEGYEVIEWPKEFTSSETFNKISPGSNSGIVEDDMSYSIYEPVREDEKNYYVGIVYFPKNDFDQWLADFTEDNIDIGIGSAHLRQTLIREFLGSKWWVKLI